jgi:ankyrin repeat protein
MKTIPTWVFVVIIGGLLAVDVIFFAAFLWQRAEIGRLRRELTIAGQSIPRRPPSPALSAVDKEAAYEAARTGDLEGLKATLDRHPELLNARVSGATPLHAAVYYQQTEIVEELLRRKASVNARNGIWLTPLHNCASSGTEEIAKLLLAHGADVTMTNKAGQTPLAYAIEKHRTDIADVLRRHGARE